MMSLALQNCAHNKNKKSTESSTEESAQSYRKLTPPIQLKLADIALINTNIIAYSSAMQNIAYPQTYSKLLIDNDLKNFIDSNNCEGIRIGKGLYKNSTDLTYSQNFIIKF